MNVFRQSAQRLIRDVLQEDLGAGDVTTDAIVPDERRIRARILAKAPGIVAGTRIARWVFEAVDRRIRCWVVRSDGQSVRGGQAIIALAGPARGILVAERTALNILGHLSGIASLTHQFVQRVRPYHVKIMDTRKTLPGLRLLEKYAVRVGGGHNHRMGLHDAILIKTNHLNALRQERGDRREVIGQAVKQARRRAKGKFVEIEATNLRELMAALHAKPDAILLDNWLIPEIRKAVVLRNLSPHTSHLRPLLEVSGGVTLANVRRIAKTGIDRISIGRLTHSAPALDVSLEVL